MGPLLESNGHKVILLIGDHFTNWYNAVPLPDQQASITATALIEHWISRFGGPHTLHIDQGRYLEPRFWNHLFFLLEMGKSRTTSFHPQSNAVLERMNRTFQKMLAKCINAEQNNWSQQLPFAKIAYHSSVRESTQYTPHFLVRGRETSLPLDLMFPSLNLNVQLMSMKLPIKEKKLLGEHLTWYTTTLTRIGDNVTP